MEATGLNELKFQGGKPFLRNAANCHLLLSLRACTDTEYGLRIEFSPSRRCLMGIRKLSKTLVIVQGWDDKLET